MTGTQQAPDGAEPDVDGGSRVARGVRLGKVGVALLIAAGFLTVAAGRAAVAGGVAWALLGLGLGWGYAGSALGVRRARGCSRSQRWVRYFQTLGLCLLGHLLLALALLPWLDALTWFAVVPTGFLAGGVGADALRVLRARWRQRG